jgi:hypothetical protein
MTRVRRTVAFSCDSYLQAASPDQRRYIKVAELRLVNNIAPDFQFLAIVVDAFVDGMVIGCSYHQPGAHKVIPGVFGLYQLGILAAAESHHHIVYMLCHDQQACPGLKQTTARRPPISRNIGYFPMTLVLYRARCHGGIKF